MEQYYSSDPGVFFVGLLVIAVINFIPSFIAYAKDHPNRLLILIINLLMGWTIIGWVLLMVWATRGGKSGILT